MPSRYQSNRYCIRVFVSSLLIGLMILGPMPGSRAAANDEEAPEHDHALQIDDDQRERFAQLGQELQRAYRAARVALQELPFEDFAPGARQESIGQDADALFAWVRDETRWLAYRGALRGARGTLMDRMGSHLDRALLLATMLEEADHEVRLAHAELDDTQAETLAEIATAELPRQPAPLADDPDALGTSLARASQLLDADTGELRQRLFEAQTAAQQSAERVIEQGFVQSQSLARMLDWDETADPDAISGTETSAALRDHWWVQVRTDEGWKDLDPSARSHEPGDRAADVQPTDIYAPGELPDEQYHRLSIEVVAEQLADEELVEHVALSHALRSAESIGQPITLSFLPLDWSASSMTLAGEDGLTDPAQWRDRAMEEDEWLPVLNVAGNAVTEASILTDGRVNESPAESPTGRAATQALGALSGIGRSDDRDETHLTAVFVRLTVEAPGRDAERFQRPVVDLLGPAQRNAEPASLDMTDAMRGQRGLALLGTLELLAQPCWMPQTYALAHSLDGLLQNRQAIFGAVHGLSRGDLNRVEQATETVQPSGSRLVGLAAQRHQLSPHREAVALDRLNLLSYVQLPRQRDNQPVVWEGYDIIQNAVAVLPDTEADPRQARLMQGVVDTALEAELHASDGPMINTSRQYAQAMADGAQWQVLRDRDQLDDLPDWVDADARQHMDAALAAGNAVVLPEQPTDKALTWWRIDPASGASLGVGPEGRGSALTEYLMTMHPISFVIAMFGLYACSRELGSFSGNAGCCLLMWGLSEGGGLAAGGAAAVAAGAAGIGIVVAILVGLTITGLTENAC